MKLILILAAILAFAFGGTAEAAEQNLPTISVSGEGVVEAAPDRATISLGIVNRDKNASKVQSDNARIAADIIQAISSLGVERRNIRTGNYSFHQVYRTDGSRRIQDGYEANNTVTVIVEDLSLVGKIIDAALANGANNVDSLNFGIRNKTNLINDAIRLAVRDARAKAEVVASELGKKIVGVRSISVNSGSISAPRMNKMMMRDAVAAESYETPIESGTLSCNASVHVEFEMSR
ncbi:MAG: SIMPL domain-containing protein [Selenomonadaceae bacterium]|nr:SIMPL domain-containing protein [Selenomonadaceae bacterium]